MGDFPHFWTFWPPGVGDLLEAQAGVWWDALSAHPTREEATVSKKKKDKKKDKKKKKKK